MIRTHKKELLHLSDKMMETLISLTNMVNKTFNEMDMLDHQIKKIGSDIENLKQKVPEQGNKLYIPCGPLITEQRETHQKPTVKKLKSLSYKY